MMRARFPFLLALVVLVLLAGLAQAGAQTPAPDSAPMRRYLLVWSDALEPAPRTKGLPEGEFAPDTPRLPDGLRALLGELEAEGQVVLREEMRGEMGLPLWATREAAARLRAHPETLSLELLGEGQGDRLPGAEAAYTISGQVVDSNGSPREGVRIRASTSTNSYWCDARTTYTAADGTYSLTVNSPGTYLVEAWSERRLVAVPPDASGVNFVYPEATAISGRVTDGAGQPLPAITVWTIVAAGALRVETDTDGRYTLEVPPGTYQVSASRRGYAPPVPQTVTVPPAAQGVDLQFPAGYTVEGIVRSDGGDPLPGALVEVSGPTGAAGVSSAADGSYALHVPAGSYYIGVEKSSYTSPPVQAVDVPPGRPELDLVLTYLTGSSIAGSVRDAGGSPVAGAYVRARGPEYAVDTTDAAGAYELSGLVPGGYQVSVTKSGLPSPAETAVFVPPSQTGIDFTLPAHYALEGTVRDGAGQPLPEAAVTAENRTCGLPGGSAKADANGAYRMELAAGTYDLTVSSGSYAGIAVPGVQVPPLASVDLSVPLPELHEVSGTVRDQAGQPIEGAGIYARGCSGPGANAKSAADGSYTLHLAEGIYPLSASAGGYVGQSRLLVVGGEVPGVYWALEAAAEACCSVAGYVVDEQGDPVYDVEVSAHGPDYAFDWTDACGRYLLTLDLPGDYTLAAQAEGYVSPAPMPVTLPDDRLFPDLVVSKVPGPTTTVSGTVSGPDGNPVGGATVWVFVCSSRLPTGWFCGASAHYADPLGRYAVTVPAGEHDVEAEKECYESWWGGWTTTPPDAVVDATLRRAAHTVTGRLSDNHGRPVYGAQVSADSPDGWAHDHSDSNGDYRLRVPAGTWEVFPYGPWECPYIDPPSQLVTVPPDQAGVDFCFLAGDYRVEGTLTTSGGAPLAGAGVKAESELGSMYTYSEGSGRYTLLLPAGTWQVQPWVSGCLWVPETWTVTVPPDREGIDFRVNPIVGRVRMPVVMK